MLNIGDVVYRATQEQTEKWITCPYCVGQRYLTVIFGDGEKATIKCNNCSIGFDPSSGRVKTYEYESKVEAVEIDSISRGVDGSFEYSGNKTGSVNAYSYVRLEPGEYFDTKEEAEMRVLVLTELKREQEASKHTRKTDESKTWRWHATSYRRQIIDAKRTLEYATECLDYATKMQAKHEKKRA